MDHPVGMCAADALRAGGQAERGVQLIELVVSAAKDVGRIGDVPQLACPGHDRPDAGLIGSAVCDGQLRIDAAEARGITGRCVVDGGLPRVRKGCAGHHAQRQEEPDFHHVSPAPTFPSRQTGLFTAHFERSQTAATSLESLPRFRWRPCVSTLSTSGGPPGPLSIDSAFRPGKP